MINAPSLADRRWQILSVGFCTLFGIVFILNVHPVGDGLWYWYAVALRHGENLYRDMQVPMQPLFILLTVWTQELLGSGWLASKALAAIQVLLYAFGLYLVASKIAWSDRKRGLLILAVFGMTMMAIYYRFDDYHVTGHCLVVFSIYLLLRVEETASFTQMLWIVVLLGFLSGLGIGNRLNDGGLLFLATGVCLSVFAPKKKIASLAVYSAVAGVTLLSLIGLTRSSLHDWMQFTIIRAAAIKGGTGNIFFAPLHLPISIANHMLWREDPNLRRDLLLVILLVAVIVALRCTGTLRGKHRTLTIVLSAVCCMPIVASLIQQSLSGSTILAIADPLVLGAYFLLVWLAVRYVSLASTSKLNEWNHREILILLPFGQLVSGAMTSGQSILETYSPLALLMLVLPFIVPSVIAKRWANTAYVAMLAVVAAGAFISKGYHPFFWHHYNDRAFFVQRQWFDHQSLGPMYIENDQLAFMQTLCSKMPPTSNHAEILAMPWPYPNYFCGRPPWKNYVQTWYDTTGATTIDQLMSDLKQPPEWIVYERGLGMMEANEKVFRHGLPLPHRALDRMILDNLHLNKWALPWQQCFGGSDWLVIHTRPPAPGESNDSPLPSDKHVNLCSTTDY
jgi:hypothetical protein